MPLRQAILARARRILLFLVLGFASTAVLQAAARAEDVAVIANRDVPVANLRFNELRNLALGERQFWSASLRITLLVRPPESHEQQVVLRRLYEMSDAAYRQYWIARVFRAEAVSGPRVAMSDEAAGILASSIPGGLSFVDAGRVPRGVKVLRIDGRLPGEAGYPLH